MKRTLVSTIIASLTVSVVLAGPASADIFGNTLTISADNTMGDVPMVVSASIDCGNYPASNVNAVLNATVPVGEQRGEVPSCHNPAEWLPLWTLTLNGVECSGGIANPSFDYLSAWFHYDDGCVHDQITIGNTEYTRYFMFEKNDDGVYNLTVTPPQVWQEVAALSETAPVAAADVNADPDASLRTKAVDTGYLTRQPNRVTAMANRFVNHPGDMVNIHAYGPDEEAALARAGHVRGHLLSEISRLGGNPDLYPVMVVYAGDLGHKDGVHVTIHQHSRSSITVPEDGVLTIGVTS